MSIRFLMTIVSAMTLWKEKDELYMNVIGGDWDDSLTISNISFRLKCLTNLTNKSWVCAMARQEVQIMMA